MGIKVSPKKIASFMLLIVLILLILDIAGQISRFFFGYDSGLVSAFDFGREGNFPTYYSSISLLFCAGLLAVVAVSASGKKAKDSFRWGLLSAIFVYLSVDEMLVIHERLIAPVRNVFHATGVLFYTWVIPYGVLLIIFMLGFLGFLRGLSKKIRALFIASGTIYVFGALGMELLGSLQSYHHGSYSVVSKILQTVEELLEMVGVVIFAYAIATHIKIEMKNVTFEFEEDTDSSRK